MFHLWRVLACEAGGLHHLIYRSDEGHACALPSDWGLVSSEQRHGPGPHQFWAKRVSQGDSRFYATRARLPLELAPAEAVRMLFGFGEDRRRWDADGRSPFSAWCSLVSYASKPSERIHLTVGTSTAARPVAGASHSKTNRV